MLEGGLDGGAGHLAPCVDRLMKTVFQPQVTRVEAGGGECRHGLADVVQSLECRERRETIAERPSGTDACIDLEERISGPGSLTSLQGPQQVSCFDSRCIAKGEALRRVSLEDSYAAAAARELHSGTGANPQRRLALRCERPVTLHTGTEVHTDSAGGGLQEAEVCQFTMIGRGVLLLDAVCAATLAEPLCGLLDGCMKVSLRVRAMRFGSCRDRAGRECAQQWAVGRGTQGPPPIVRQIAGTAQSGSRPGLLEEAAEGYVDGGKVAGAEAHAAANGGHVERCGRAKLVETGYQTADEKAPVQVGERGRHYLRVASQDLNADTELRGAVGRSDDASNGGRALLGAEGGDARSEQCRADEPIYVLCHSLGDPVRRSLLQKCWEVGTCFRDLLCHLRLCERQVRPDRSNLR